MAALPSEPSVHDDLLMQAGITNLIGLFLGDVLGLLMMVGADYHNYYQVVVLESSATSFIIVKKEAPDPENAKIGRINSLALEL